MTSVTHIMLSVVVVVVRNCPSTHSTLLAFSLRENVSTKNSCGSTLQVQCCFTTTEAIRTIRDGEPRTATSTFTQLLSSVLQCCFTSTEIVRTVRERETGTATSTSTQLLSFENIACEANNVALVLYMYDSMYFGVGKRLHTLPAHPILDELQGFS